MEVKQQAIKGVQWTSLSMLIRAFIQLVQLSIVARYLTAEEIGLFALIQVFFSFFLLLSGVGIGTAIVQKQSVITRHLSELFIINIIFTFIVSISIYFSGALLAELFNVAKLQLYVEFLAVLFFVAAVSKIHLALLEKQLSFSLIAKIELVSAAVGFLIVIVLVINEFSIFALLYGMLVSTLLQTLLFLIFSSFRPRLCKVESWSEIKSYLYFSINHTSSAILNYFNSQFDIILIGKLLGPEVLGGYSLARQFCYRPAMIINPIFTRVAFPIMSKLQGNKKVGSIFCQLSHILALLNFPIYIALFILAEPIVQLIFGVQWLHIAPIFRVMAIWCLVRSISNPKGALLMALGKVSLALKWNLALFFTFPFAIFLGTFYGIFGVVISMLIMQFLLLPIGWYYLLNKTINITAKEFFKALYAPFIMALLAGSFAWFALLMSQSFLYWQQLIFATLIGAISYSVMTYKANTLFRNICKGNISFE